MPRLAFADTLGHTAKAFNIQVPRRGVDGRQLRRQLQAVGYSSGDYLNTLTWDIIKPDADIRISRSARSMHPAITIDADEARWESRMNKQSLNDWYIRAVVNAETHVTILVYLSEEETGT